MSVIALEEAQKRIGAPPAFFAAMARSGLLGFHDGKGVPVVAVEHLIRYGTQWREELGSRSWGGDPFQEMPVPEGIEGGEQPPSTHTQVQISSSPDLEAGDKDVAWIAQFYIRPNSFYFSDPTAVALVGPIALKIDQTADIKGSKFPTRLYPDPEGRLAMVQVVGNAPPGSDALMKAYDSAVPALDLLSAHYDQPLPIAHAILVGVPSGIITIEIPKPSKVGTINGQVSLWLGDHQDLRDALALYREGISSGNPFHQFLTLWKCYENLCAVRGEWRRKNQRRDEKKEPEVFPHSFVFGTYAGMPFDRAKQQMNGPYRVALAHGDVQQGKPRTAATAKETWEVRHVIPIIRHMARVTLFNVGHAFSHGEDSARAQHGI